MKSLSRVQLCDPMDRSLPGSSLHGILQARVLEWVAISFSSGSSDPGIEPGSPAFQANPWFRRHDICCKMFPSSQGPVFLYCKKNFNLNHDFQLSELSVRKLLRITGGSHATSRIFTFSSGKLREGQSEGEAKQARLPCWLCGKVRFV